MNVFAFWMAIAFLQWIPVLGPYLTIGLCCAMQLWFLAPCVFVHTWLPAWEPLGFVLLLMELGRYLGFNETGIALRSDVMKMMSDGNKEVSPHRFQRIGITLTHFVWMYTLPVCILFAMPIRFDQLYSCVQSLFLVWTILFGVHIYGWIQSSPFRVTPGGQCRAQERRHFLKCAAKLYATMTFASGMVYAFLCHNTIGFSTETGTMWIKLLGVVL